MNLTSYLKQNWPIVILGLFWGFMAVGRFLNVVQWLSANSIASLEYVFYFAFNVLPAVLAAISAYGITLDRKYGYFAALLIPVSMFIVELVNKTGNFPYIGMLLIEIPPLYLLYRRHYQTDKG